MEAHAWRANLSDDPFLSVKSSAVTALNLALGFAAPLSAEPKVLATVDGVAITEEDVAIAG